MVLECGCVSVEECACAASNAQNCYSRDRSCAWFTAYILICSHGLSYHRIKYVNMPVEGSLWQRQPRLNTISLNEATQSAFTTDTDSSLFGTSSVGLFGCLFMPLCESVWMKVRVRHGVYIRGLRMYLEVVVAVYAYVCLQHSCVFYWVYLCIPAHAHICVYMHIYMLCLCIFASVLVCFHQCVIWVFVVAVLWPISSTAHGWSVSVA